MSDDAIQSYRDLRVWREAMLRRAAASIPANIAEGYGRESTGHYIHFLRIAQGSGPCNEPDCRLPTAGA